MIAQLDWNTASNYLNAVSMAISQAASPSVVFSFQTYLSTIKLILQYIQTWYSNVQLLQDLQAKMSSLDQIQQYLSNVIQEQANQLSVISAAEAALQQQKSRVVFSALQWFVQEVIQFQYYTLAPYQLQLPQNPTSEELTELQNGFNEYLGHNPASQTKTCDHGQYSFGIEDHPTLFDDLLGNGTIVFDVPLPATAFYYSVYFSDVGVYFWNPNSTVAGSVTVEMVKAGQSVFYDQNGAIWTFNHAPIPYEFGYQIANDQPCPVECPNSNPIEINYSPYGLWQITVSSSQLEFLREIQPTFIVVDFKLVYAVNESLNPNDASLFGNNPWNPPKDGARRAREVSKEVRQLYNPPPTVLLWPCGSRATFGSLGRTRLGRGPFPSIAPGPPGTNGTLQPRERVLDP